MNIVDTSVYITGTPVTVNYQIIEYKFSPLVIIEYCNFGITVSNSSFITRKQKHPHTPTSLGEAANQRRRRTDTLFHPKVSTISKSTKMKV